jgi:hypothetical protein
MNAQEIKEVEERALEVLSDEELRKRFEATDDTALRSAYKTASFFSASVKFWERKATALQQETERLKSLIKDVEYACYESNNVDVYCPWCGIGLGFPHDRECDAFTPDGSVK